MTLGIVRGTHRQKSLAQVVLVRQTWSRAVAKMSFRCFCAALAPNFLGSTLVRMEHWSAASSWVKKEIPRPDMALPSGNLTVCYWKLSFIVDLPVENCDFPYIVMLVYQRVESQQNCRCKTKIKRVVSQNLAWSYVSSMGWFQEHTFFGYFIRMWSHVIETKDAKDRVRVINTC